MTLVNSRSLKQLGKYKTYLALRTLSSTVKPNPTQVISQQHYVNKKQEEEKRITYHIPTPPTNRERKTFLQLFNSEHNVAINVISFFNAIKFTPYGLKKFWKELQDHKLYLSQQYMPERAAFLGPELATAHFVCHRGGKVKFYDMEDWYEMDKDTLEVENLPRFFNRNFKIEAVDCSGMELIYEGLENIKNMDCPKWFSFEGCPHIDDWCLDRLAGEYGHCIEYLNIRDCPKLTESGIACLSRMSNLKTLVLGGHPKAEHIELACLMLEDALPDLQIQGIVYCDQSLLETIKRDSN